MSNIAIKVENLSKRYRIGLKEEMHDTLTGALTSWIKSPIANYKRLRKLSHFDDVPPLTNGGNTNHEKHHNGQLITDSTDEASDIIWAIREVSFEVKQGQVMGIIGHNGAGKTTLLKIISRITEPTSGRIVINGRVSSLLEVGTGFHPELTGLENIYLNGTVLGMSKAEVNRKLDEIIDFSGVEKFIDTPVKRYSSGMRVRLAFSVAAHLEPDILLIDEVLAVGDAAFQGKCLGKMDHVAKEGRTVLFVSHNMGMIQSLCEHVILLSAGEIADEGIPKEVISTYLDGLEKPATHFTAEPDSSLSFQILEVSSRDQDGRTCARFDIAEPVVIVVKYAVRDKLIGSAVSLKVFKGGMVLCTSFDTDGMEGLLESRHPGLYRARITIPEMLLKAGRYSANVGAVILNRGAIDYVESAVVFDIDTSSVGDSLKSFASMRAGLVSIPMHWETSLNGA